MIPFLPEDAVVDKKKDTYTSTESGGAVYKGTVQSQGFSPPASFVGKYNLVTLNKRTITHMGDISVHPLHHKTNTV